MRPRSDFEGPSGRLARPRREAQAAGRTSVKNAKSAPFGALFKMRDSGQCRIARERWGKPVLLRLESGAGLELDGLGSLNLDPFLGLGVDAGAGFAVNDGECPKTDELYLLLLLNARLDGVENCVERAFRASLGGFGAEEFLYFCDEVCFIHIRFVLFLLLYRRGLRTRLMTQFMYIFFASSRGK